MERIKVVSSNIKSIGYAELTKTLEIEFTKSGVYQYKDVPKEIYEGFSKAESIGKYFYANIKSNRALKFEKVIEYCMCINPTPIQSKIDIKKWFCSFCGNEILQTRDI